MNPTEETALDEEIDGELMERLRGEIERLKTTRP